MPEKIIEDVFLETYTGLGPKGFEAIAKALGQTSERKVTDNILFISFLGLKLKTVTPKEIESMPTTTSRAFHAVVRNGGLNAEGLNERLSKINIDLNLITNPPKMSPSEGEGMTSYPFE